MMKRARHFCVLLIFSTLGVYIGKWIWLICDHAAHPGFYEQFSAPWYAQMLPYTLMAAGLMAAGAAVYLALRLAEKRRKEREKAS